MASIEEETVASSSSSLGVSKGTSDDKADDAMAADSPSSKVGQRGAGAASGSNAARCCRRQRRMLMLALAGVCVIAVAAVLGGTLLFGKRSKDHENVAADSTGGDAGAKDPVDGGLGDDPIPPDVAREEAILKFLTSAVGSGQNFEEGSSYALAADWILHRDPLGLTLDSPNLLQRFSLASMYYEITSGETRPELWCQFVVPNPPDDDLCEQENRWLSGEPECSWNFIGCETAGSGYEQVTSLQLWFNRGFQNQIYSYPGNLPSSVSLLSGLRSLSLKGFYGFPPESLYELTNLEKVEVTSDCLGLPSQIGLLKKLRHLDLKTRYCFSDSGIPSEIGQLQKLEFLSLFSADSSLPLPEELFDLGGLKHLDIFNLGLSGKLSTRIGLMTSLTHLNLRYNNFVGPLPSEIGMCSRLAFLDFSSIYGITGPLPDEIYHLPALTSISFTHTHLTGTISAAIGNLRNLEKLAIGGDLTGSIPSQVGNLDNLKHFAVAGTNMNGTIPHELFDLVELTDLDLSYVPLTGSLASDIGLLTELQSLVLKNVSLTGAIPSELGNLANLVTLRIRNTLQTGSIPNFLCPHLDRPYTDCRLGRGEPPIACDCCLCCYRGDRC